MTTSSRIGEKLLAGWTLLGESCPQSCCAAPLLRARTPGAKLYCPQHDGFVADAAMDEPAAAQPSGGASYDSAEHEDARLGPYAKAPAQAQAPSAPPRPAAAKPDAVIADYLLNGWTMLGEACPIAECYSPLMWQKKERRKFCPVHQLYVMTDVEAARGADAPQSEAAAPAPEAPAAPASTPPPSLADLLATTARGASVAQVVDAAVPALLDQISKATAALKTAPTASARELVALIADSAAAIKALRAL